jgi:alkylhydroperoxidase family enzyme
MSRGTIPAGRGARGQNGAGRTVRKATLTTTVNRTRTEEDAVARIDLPEGEGLDVGKALMLTPHFIDVVVGYEKAIAASPIDPRLHELVRYRVALINQCTVCLDFRRNDSGIDEPTFTQIEAFRDSTLFSDTEKQALVFTEMFCTNSADIPDELIEDLQGKLGTAGLADLALVIGKYMAMGRFMQVLGLDQACKIDHDRLAGVAGS